MSESTVIELSEPIQFGSETISRLELRKPHAGDLRGLRDVGDYFATCLDLAAKLAGQPPSVLDRLGLKDAEKVIEVAGPFVYGSQRPGQIS